MDPAALLVVGLEAARFAPSDAAADALAGSLESVESGGWSLPPWDGPALQPTVAVRRGALEIGLAPAVAVRRETARSVDAREGTVNTLRWRAETRARWTSETWFAGADAALSGGRATLDGEEVAVAAPVFEVGPTAGARAALGEEVALLGRARLPLRFGDDALSVALGGALAVEWTPCGSSRASARIARAK